jgi:hypothetical protein
VRANTLLSNGDAVRQLFGLNELHCPVEIVVMRHPPDRPGCHGSEDAEKRAGALNGRLTNF